MKKTKKEVYKETYAKGTVLLVSEFPKIMKYLRSKGVTVYIHAAGKNDDDTEFWNITIDNIPPQN